MTQNEVNFLNLPTEIRLQIYDHIFTGQTLRAKAIHYPLNHQEHQGYTSLQPPALLLSILFTCHKTHHESIPRFYSLVRFRFERHSTDEINWSLSSVMNSLPVHPSPGISQTTNIHNQTQIQIQTKDLVNQIIYAGNDPTFLRSVDQHFPNLKTLEFDLSWDHIGIDQINFDRAMKMAARNSEWRHAVKYALETRFPDGMVEAVFELQKKAFSGSSALSRGVNASSGQGEGRTFGRGFRVLLHWSLAYRFIEFVGECDLDEWILRVRDPDGKSKNVYEIRQDPMFYEMF